ncbi:MAG: DUF2125 domain-containing protein [Pseudorhodobacter sp.]|nr:DUF2125 domain-containing protein [Pseudorhodobacter sp.]
MRTLMAVVIGLALAWSGYWLVGADALETAAHDWFADQTAQGRLASHDSLVVHGFPSRFDLTIQAPKLADPATGLGWQAPFVQILSLSYKPWHIIAALPETQQFFTADQVITLTSTHLKASLIVKPGSALALDRIAVVGEGLQAVSSLGWQIAADHARFASRQDTTQRNAHQIGIELTDLAPDPGLIAALSGQSDLPALIAIARLDAVVSLSAPLDRHAGQTQPRLTALAVKEGLIRWGSMVLYAKGSITPDAQGLAQGRINLRAENWPEALTVATEIGLISPEVAPTLDRALTLLAEQSGQALILDLPLSFQSGYMSLGPIPLGSAPRLN